MSDRAELARRIESIEAGYEFLLAYAAQGRQDDTGSSVREALNDMHQALTGLGELITRIVAESSSEQGRRDAAAFLQALALDADTARAAIGLVLGRGVLASALIDNLNASIHVRALLTDLFLVDQALKAAPL
jgi:hypothetical protein